MEKFLFLIFCAALNLHTFECRDKNPLVIAHRGASGYLPEHTLEAKVAAYMMGVWKLQKVTGIYNQIQIRFKYLGWLSRARCSLN